MRVSWIWFLLTFILVRSQAPASDDAEMMVFILAGQSNMVPHGIIDDLPDDLKTPPERVSVFGNGWEPISKPSKFGVEYSFACAMAKEYPTRKIGILRLGVGGTSLFKDCDPENSTSLFAKLIKLSQDALKAPHTTLAGMVWLQGENDSYEKESAEKYGEHLKAFATAVRNRLNMPDMPILIGHIKPHPSDSQALTKKCPFIDLVQKAQAELSLPKTQLVHLDTIPRGSDHIHYDGKGSLAAGNLFADAAKELLRKK